MGGEAGRAPSGGLRSCACSRTGWGRHHHHHGDGRLVHIATSWFVHYIDDCGNGDGRLLYTLLPVGLYITLMTVVMEMVECCTHCYLLVCTLH